ERDGGGRREAGADRGEGRFRGGPPRRHGGHAVPRAGHERPAGPAAGENEAGGADRLARLPHAGPGPRPRRDRRLGRGRHRPQTLPVDHAAEEGTEAGMTAAGTDPLTPDEASTLDRLDTYLAELHAGRPPDRGRWV